MILLCLQKEEGKKAVILPRIQSQASPVSGSSAGRHLSHRLPSHNPSSIHADSVSSRGRARSGAQPPRDADAAVGSAPRRRGQSSAQTACPEDPLWESPAHRSSGEHTVTFPPKSPGEVAEAGPGAGGLGAPESSRDSYLPRVWRQGELILGNQREKGLPVGVGAERAHPPDESLCPRGHGGGELTGHRTLRLPCAPAWPPGGATPVVQNRHWGRWSREV